MMQLSSIHFVLLCFVIVLIFFGRRKTPRGGPPTHPLPVSSSLEGSRVAKRMGKKRNWHAAIRMFRS
jgi:hypothetical protein